MLLDPAFYLLTCSPALTCPPAPFSHHSMLYPHAHAPMVTDPITTGPASGAALDAQLQVGTQVRIKNRPFTFNSLRCIDINIPAKGAKSARHGGGKKVQVAWTRAGTPAACREIRFFSKPGCKGSAVGTVMQGRQRARKIARPVKSVRCIIAQPIPAPTDPPAQPKPTPTDPPTQPTPSPTNQDICQACPTECRCDAASEGSDSPPEPIDSPDGSLDFMEDDTSSEPLPADEDICQACPAECRCNATLELDDSLLEPVDTTDDDLPPAPSPTDPDVCGSSTRNPCK
ncbi:unnamed protein product, partial [Closterium sp. Naga37s-1]